MEATKKVIESMGGKLEAYYYAFGENDYYLIVDQPESVNVIAGTLIANATGTVKLKTTVFITPEEVDQAVKTTFDWRPPGQCNNYQPLSQIKAVELSSRANI